MWPVRIGCSGWLWQLPASHSDNDRNAFAPRNALALRRLLRHASEGS